jgi:signal transduction histidine kinase
MQAPLHRRAVRWIALALGCTIALALPAVFMAEAVIEKSEHLENAAQLAADNIAREAYGRGPLWRRQTQRLLELLEVNPVVSEPVRAAVADAAGEPIVATDEVLGWPVLRASAHIVVPADAGGTVTIETSLRPTLARAALIGVFGLALGLLAFAVVYLLPMRVIERALGDLDETQRLLRDQRAAATDAYSEMARNQERAAASAAERTRALERAEEASEQAAAASRTKSEFLANMSHELRTPLNAIIGFSEVMMQQMFGPLGNERYREYAADVHNSGRHLLAIINDILDLSKIEAGRLELRMAPLDPRTLVDVCDRLVRERAKSAQLRFVVELPDGPTPAVLGDDTKLKQILLNLLSNAFKFTAPGREVRLTLVAGDDGVSFTVADQGVGMSEDELATALEPFRQVDNSLSRRHEGTGLGLPLAKRLTELHGGSLSITSIKGEGTVAVVWLPAAVSDAIPEQPAAA